ncbi:MAG: VWA domain-containing protein [Bryobacterales bacterium]|nr:VWA domain-containing protein [Bryobacterales bacterium]
MQNGALFLLGFTLSLPGQEVPVELSPSDPVFRAETVLMEVEVKVTDKQGRAVSDLNREDFRLLENGESQNIRSFEYVAEPSLDKLAAREARDPSTRDSTAKAQRPDRLPQGTTWIYITGRVNPEDRKRVWRRMTQFLDQNLQPGVLVSIEGGQFTSSRATLQDGVRQLIERGGTPGSLADLESGQQGVRFGEIEYDPRYQARIDNLNDVFADLARQRMRYFGDFFLYRYIDLVKSLSVLPGKKVVILLTRGALGTNANKDVMRRLIAEAIRARVTFYVVETPRLSARNPYLPDATFPGYQLPADGSLRIVLNSADYNVPRMNMGLPASSLTAPTGGKAARNVLGLGSVLTAVSDSLRGYYVIGYSPEDPNSEDRRRNIRIEVNHPRLTLDYRKAYYEPTHFARLSPTERRIDLHHYLKHDVPFTDIPLTLAYDFFRSDDGEAVLYASVGIHSSYLPVGKQKKRSEIRFTALAQARNVERRKDPFYVQKDVQIRASAKYLEAFLQARGAVLHVPIEMKLGPGKYEWKVVLRNEHSGDVGTYKTVIVLPDLAGREQSSSLLLTGCYSSELVPQIKRRDMSSSSASAQEGVLVDRKRFYTDSSHTYRKGDPIYLVYDLYDVPAQEESTLPATKLMLIRGQQQMNAPEVTDYRYEWRRESSDVRYLMALDSAGLAPGDYQLLAVLPNGKEAIYRNFSVVADKQPDLWLDPSHALMSCKMQ